MATATRLQHRTKTGAVKTVPRVDLEASLTQAGIDINSPHAASALSAASTAHETRAGTTPLPQADGVVVDTTRDNLLFRVRLHLEVLSGNGVVISLAASV